jgi:hypothetical protein
MFRRDVYRAMARVLGALDAGVLARTSFRLGGGTGLALAHHCLMPFKATGGKLPSYRPLR